ncbi:MAG: acetoacetate--CoA ligase [Betaproteobacteria bacterium]|nr:acetoacetate--CoA ligase [Betaproteobacteria bacterium]
MQDPASRANDPEQPLWRPDAERIRRAHITAFTELVNRRHGLQLQDYDALWRWSIDDLGGFWSAVWDSSGVIAGQRGERDYVPAEAMSDARFFPDARLNFAENLLRFDGEQAALVFWGEDKVRRTLSRRELREEVSRMQQWLRGQGVGVGDRVAAYLPNMPETVVLMLAATSLGAVFTSASPDFGVQGLVDRFGQVAPKVLVACDGYFYGGKTVGVLDKLREALPRLPGVQSLLVVPYVARAQGTRADLTGLAGPGVGAQTWEQALQGLAPRTIEYVQLPFDHPLYILYSSGTTGAPKCIVHRAGGVLLKHLCEHRLQADVHEGDRLFYFTTCGWMMWNWLVSGLTQGATLCLFDGSPFANDGKVLFDFADAADFTHFGTSAKFIEALGKTELQPARTHRLQSLRTVFSTGSPLVPEGFDIVYERIKRDVCLSSISGGTDLVACFTMGAPTLPVWRGEIQAAGLGMAVAVVDEDGKPLPDGRKGELVCTRPFPTMPLGFLVDGSLDKGREKFLDSYFRRMPGVWHHGDYIERTAHHGYIIYGRSDATLNPGGVRIGTAEIYRQVEKLPEVAESLVIGQNWPPGTYNDVRIVLFVKLREGLHLDDAMIDRVKGAIRANTTPRHVPARVVQVHDIPRTKSNKIVELAVRNVVHGEEVRNLTALANPEALDEYRGLRTDLESR